MTFKEWVRKHRIGPGMNDNHPGARKFVEELATGEGKLGERFGESAKDQVSLMDEQLYSGFDGDVGPGWVPILDRLAEDLIKLGWDRDLHQVKEKFGTLRFYIGRDTPEIDKRIQQAEEESAVTCEECGKPGKLCGTGWVITLCEPCYTEYKRKRG